MINPKELRIGNLLHPLSGGNVYLPLTNITYRVHSICLFELKMVNNINKPFAQQVPFIIRCKNVTPVEISKEWLERFCFIEQKDHVENTTMIVNGGDNGFNGAIRYSFDYKNVFFYKRKFFYIIDVNSDVYGKNYTSKEIKYIHQLQNIYFALEGKELEIIK